MTKIKVKNLIPVANLRPEIQKNILATLRKYTFEEFLLALLLKTMFENMDERDLRIKYIQQMKRAVGKIVMAAAYINNMIDASNRVWLDSFAELPGDVSMAGFIKTFIFRREDQYKKMGVNLKNAIKMDKLHGAGTNTMHTLKVVSLMLSKVKDEVAKDEEDVELYKLSKEASIHTNIHTI